MNLKCKYGFLRNTNIYLKNKMCYKTDGRCSFNKRKKNKSDCPKK